MLQLLLSGGATHVRTHVNVDPYIGMKNLEEIQGALYRFKGKMTLRDRGFPAARTAKNEFKRVDETSDERRGVLGWAALILEAGVDNIEASLYEMVGIWLLNLMQILIFILHDPGHLWFIYDQETGFFDR